MVHADVQHIPTYWIDMRDLEIRDGLKRLIRETGRAPVVFDEMVVLRGEARIDVGVSGVLLEGWEIKSELDNLDRLESQCSAYSQVFERLNVVVADCHLAGARRIVPSYWGIWVVRRVEGEAVFLCKRRSGINRHINALSLAQLLWRDEALSLLEHIGDSGGRRAKPRHLLWSHIAMHVALPELLRFVKTFLTARCFRQPDPQLSGCDEQCQLVSTM